MEIEYLSAKFYFSTKNQGGYCVIASGKHRNIQFDVWRGDKCVYSATKEYGHANKTNALIVLKSYLNS